MSLISKVATINGDFSTIYTVTAGKTLYITSWYASGFNLYPSIKYYSILIYNDTPALWDYLFLDYLPVEGKSSASNNIVPPMPIAAGWAIKLYSSNDALYATAGITGYEI